MYLESPQSTSGLQLNFEPPNHCEDSYWTVKTPIFFWSSPTWFLVWDPPIENSGYAYKRQSLVWCISKALGDAKWTEDSRVRYRDKHSWLLFGKWTNQTRHRQVPSIIRTATTQRCKSFKTSSWFVFILCEMGGDLFWQYSPSQNCKEIFFKCECS